MTPESQRVAIAQACGHKNVRKAHFCNDHGAGDDYLSDHSDEWPIPDYLNDLNAMHEAEKVLIGEQRTHYALLLHDQTEPARLTYLMRDFMVLHATARQRAEAFLFTLNLWDDSK